MAAPRRELVATCWTHAGDAAPMRDGERSPLDILDRVDAVAEAGYAGIGFVYADLLVARETIGWERLAREVRQAGLRHTEIEFLSDWWTDGDRRTASDAMRRDLLEAAGVLGTSFVKVSGSTIDEPPRPVLLESWDALCDDARAAGTRIALEPLPFSNFRTVPDGARFVQEAAHPSGGIIVDAWHVFRPGTAFEELVAAIDPAHLFGAELDDAFDPAPPDEQLFADTIDNRVPPGEGDWDLPGLIRTLRTIGFDGPWGVELISHAHRALGLEDALRVARDSAELVLTRAD